MRFPQVNNARSRSGFTLIELLVVIAIIGLLSALGAAAYFATVNRQQLNNTRTGMQAVEKILMRQWRQVVEEAQKESIPANVRNWVAPDPTGARAKVLWTKLRLMEAFPTTANEIKDPNNSFWPYKAGLIPFDRRRNMYEYQKKAGTAIASDPNTESAACLLLSLSVARGGETLNRDTIGSAYFRDTNNDGVEEIVDGWGNPIRFFRFPTGTQLQASAPQKVGKGATFTDQYDSDGLLFTWSNVGTNRSVFEAYVHPISNGTAAWYITPVLVSAGKDQLFGLQPQSYPLGPIPHAPFVVVNQAEAGDNVNSFELKQ